MGLLDLFRAGRVVLHASRAVRRQRASAQALRALPMAELVPRSLAGLHSEHASWHATARRPRADAESLAAARRLPASLAAFYRVCDGFDASDDFPVRMLPMGELRLGADHKPPPSAIVQAFWREHGNDSEQEGCLAILPPDNLMALATDAAESFLRPSALDLMLPIEPMAPHAFTLVLLAGLGDRLPAGAVLEFENGAATRYEDFGHWLATRGTLFETLKEAASPVS